MITLEPARVRAGSAPAPAPAQAVVPDHLRTIELSVREDDGVLEVVGRLRDARPWADPLAGQVEHLHDMTLRLLVRRGDLTIVAASAEMARFPHAECTVIEGAFEGLVGLSVGRGYTKAVQARFGRELGCTHLELLARLAGPAVVQGVTSAGLRASGGSGEIAGSGDVRSRLVGSCHVWAPGGVAEQKLDLGWRPGTAPYPVPSVVELRRSSR